MKWLMIFFAGIVIGILAQAALPSFQISSEQLAFPLGQYASERSSPGDWISREQLKVYQKSITLDIPDAILTKYADTNSMDPVLDRNANGIEVPPVKEKLSVGDIISYQPSGSSAVIVHRIAQIGEDAHGTYYLVKGDNNTARDPEKVRFEQIKGVVVAVIY